MATNQIFGVFPPPKKSLLPPSVDAAADLPHLWWPLGHGVAEDLSPPTARGPRSLFVRLNVLVGAVWQWQCPLVGIMSPTFYPRPDGASSILGGRAEVCLCRISRDSVGAGLWWICLDKVFFRLRLGIYRFDPSDLRLSSLAMVATLVRCSYGALARWLSDCLLQPYARLQWWRGDDGGALSARFNACSCR